MNAADSDGSAAAARSVGRGGIGGGSAGSRVRRLVLSGGGTAGHVYPALALLDSWTGTLPEIAWIGSTDGMERGIVTDRGLPFTGVRAAAIRDRSPLRIVLNLAILCVGFFQAVAALRSLRPDVVLTTGGYVTVPVAYAAAMLRIPVVVFLPDIRPGLAVKAQARVATRIAVAFATAAEQLPVGKTTATGYPLRPALLTADRTTARRRLGLSDDLPVVLVYGGSRGAQSLNEGITARLDDVLVHCQLIHVSGSLDEPAMREKASTLREAGAGRYHLYGFIGDQLVDALVAADLAIARAGASTLAELPAVGLPAILVPGPFSDQDANAEWLAERGAGVVLDNDDVIAGALPGVLLELLDDPDRIEAMRTATASLAQRDAAVRLQQEVELAAHPL